MIYGATLAVNKKNKGKFLFGTAVVSIVGSATTAAGTRTFAENGGTTFKSLGYNKLSSKILEEYKKKMVKQFGLGSTEDLPDFDFNTFNNYTQNKIKKDNEERGAVKNILFGELKKKDINNDYLNYYLKKIYEPEVSKFVKNKAMREQVLKSDVVIPNNAVTSGNNGSTNKSALSNFFSGISSAAINFKNKVNEFVRKRSPLQLAGMAAAIMAGGYFLFFNKGDTEVSEKANKKSKTNKSASKRKETKKDELDKDDLYDEEGDDDENDDSENDEEY